MRLGIKTCTLDMSFEDMLKFCVDNKIGAVEIGTGNWSGAPHIDLDKVVSSDTARDEWYGKIKDAGLELCALNCSGNPLAYEKDWDVTMKTFELAGKLGVKTIVMMSGLPTGCPGDKTPVWVTGSWPPEILDTLKYQWEDVAIPRWKEIVKIARDCGIEKLALENHAWQLVYNPETCLRLRDAVGDSIIGMNLDPSHLFWMGGDPIEAARVLGDADALYYVHGKDSRIERRKIGPNGIFDTRTIEEYAGRAWNYVAVGCGHDVMWWKEFVSVLRMSGYDDVISLEMEDMTMSMLDGHLTSIKVLKEAMNLQ